MTIEMVSAEEDILAHLSAGMAPVPVHDIEVEDDDFDIVDDGEFTPFIGVIWGGPILDKRDRGIVSVRRDLMTSYVIIRVVTPDAATNRRLYNKVYNLMTGYYPTNSGELSPEAGMAYTNGNGQVKPTRFYREISYSYKTNTKGEI